MSGTQLLQVKLDPDLIALVNAYVVLHKTTKQEWLRTVLLDAIATDPVMQSLDPLVKQSLGIPDKY